MAIESEAQKSYILAGWFIDGSGAAPQNRILLGMQGGRIISIEPYTGLPDGATDFTDLSHCSLLPPLVDAHMHLFMSGSTCMETRRQQLAASYDELVPAIEQHLRYLYTHGVLAARDGGDYGGYAARFKAEQELLPGFQLKVAGRAWRRDKRYGSLIGRPPASGESLAEAYLRESSQDKSDLVKLVNSGLNSLQVFGKQTKPQFSRDEIFSLVKAAGKSGRKVMVHANGEEPVRRAIEAGCHSIEHGFFMGRDNLELMVEKNVVWIPTLYTMKAYAAYCSMEDYPGNPKVVLKNLEHQLDQLRQARELGVTVALGTDAGSLGVLHGEAMVEEMKLYKKAGYSTVECIRCATKNGAELLGIEDYGVLEVGRRATFLVTRGAPAQLPRKLSYLEAIYVDGKPGEEYHKNPVKHVL